jgi:hypothetical protein
MGVRKLTSNCDTKEDGRDASSRRLTRQRDEMVKTAQTITNAPLAALPATSRRALVLGHLRKPRRRGSYVLAFTPQPLQEFRDLGRIPITATRGIERRSNTTQARHACRLKFSDDGSEFGGSLGGARLAGFYTGAASCCSDHMPTAVPELRRVAVLPSGDIANVTSHHSSRQPRQHAADLCRVPNALPPRSTRRFRWSARR